MARKRSIDPDSWTDDKLVDLSIGAHLLWVGLVSLADDEGRIEWNAKQFKTRLFPVKAEATAEAVEAWMLEVSNEAVVVYESGGKQYAYHPAWRKHQYINKPTPSKLPAPPTSGPLTDALRGTGTEPEVQPIQPKQQRNTTRILPEYSLAKIGQVWECPVPLVSVSVLESVLESGDLPAGAGEPKNGEPCLCEVAKISRGEYAPESLAALFLAVYANQRSEKSRRAAMGTWTAWLREMRTRYSWDAIWSAFAQAHRDAKHGPLRGSAAMWSNLRAANGFSPQTQQRPTLKVIHAADLEDAI